MFGVDENVCMGFIDLCQGVEICGLVEQMVFDELMFCMMGDLFWVEYCEEVVFNSYLVVVMLDFKGLCYIICFNQMVSDLKNYYLGIDNWGFFLVMNLFSSCCCQYNYVQGWFYYVEYLILVILDNGVVVVMYVVCKVMVKVGDGNEIIFYEQMNYFFEEIIWFMVNILKVVSFLFYLRIFLWIEGVIIFVNGKKVVVNFEVG